jgi:hypothetical protein
MANERFLCPLPSLGRIWCFLISFENRQVQQDMLALTLWERILPVIAKIIEALSGIIERSPEELIEMLMQSHEFTKRFEWLFIAIEQHFQYPRKIA